MGEPKPQDSKIWVSVTLAVAVIGCIGVIGAALIGVLPEIIKATAPTQPTSTALINQNPTPSQDSSSSIPPTPQPTKTTVATVSSDSRDVAAQTLGYADLDAFMEAFGIPVEVKSRVFVCPNEATWCLGVFEESGQPDFHFKNVTNCTLDGKQANGVSTIPAGFDGMVKGFTVRLCGR